MVTEVDVSRWLLKVAESYRVALRDEIAVAEVATPCLRRSYFSRTRIAPPLVEQRPPPPERGPWCRDCPYTLYCR